MGTAAAVAGDLIVGACPGHLIPGPLGVPIPSPAPLPFSAPVTVGVDLTVLIQGRPAVTALCTGLNVPHVGLHPADPFFVPVRQIGTVLMGSPTVLVGGRPLARSGSAVTCCVAPGVLQATGATVLVA